MVSEFPLGVKPLARKFSYTEPCNQWFVHGNSSHWNLQKSDAKITATFALEQNREVFAVPGRVGSAASSGTSSLIARQHAKLVSSVEDILEELSLISATATNLPLSPDVETGFIKINLDNLGEKKSRILKALNGGVEEIDAIYKQTSLEMNFLLATLLELELTGTVENIGGHIYRLRVELEIPSN